MRVWPLLLAGALSVWSIAALAQPAGEEPAAASAPDAPAPNDAPADARNAPQPSSETVSMTGAPPEYVELNARIQALLRLDPLEDSVQRPLDFARAALERSRASAAAGDGAAALRTRNLARAAVELAEARLRLSRERGLFSATQARRNASLKELATEQQAVAKERQRALELQRESAAP